MDYLKVVLPYAGSGLLAMMGIAFTSPRFYLRIHRLTEGIAWITCVFMFGLYGGHLATLGVLADNKEFGSWTDVRLATHELYGFLMTLTMAWPMVAWVFPIILKWIAETKLAADAEKPVGG
jgi:hypothetical protein